MRTSAKSSVAAAQLFFAVTGALEGAAVAGAEVVAVLFAPVELVESDAGLLEASGVLPAPSPEDFGLALP